jgi:pimeloyl-ACP methyl ester carboxylesterase
MLAYDDTRQLARIEAPALLLWAERDALFFRTDQDRVIATLTRAKLTVYEERGHCPNWERRELVAADIARLLHQT